MTAINCSSEVWKCETENVFINSLVFTLCLPLMDYCFRCCHPCFLSMMFLNANPSSGPHAKPPSGPHANPSSGPHANPSSGPHTNPSSGPHANPSSGPHANPSSGPHTNPSSGPHTNPSSGPHANPSSGPHTNPSSGSNAKSPMFTLYISTVQRQQATHLPTCRT